MTQAFIDYWNAVDAAMQKHFGLDTYAANIGARLIADAQDHGWSPEHFAFWCGENYSLPIVEGGLR